MGGGELPAAKAGIQSGDQIVRVEDIAESELGAGDLKATLSPNQPLRFGIERNGKVTEKVLVPEPYGSNQYGAIGWVPQEPTVTLTLVEPGMPAAKAGMKVGDEILTVNGQPIPAPRSAHPALEPHQRSASATVILRNGQKQTVTVKPVLSPGGGAQGPAYRIGVASLPTKVIEAQFFGRAETLSIGQQEKLFPHPGVTAKDGAAQSLDASGRWPDWHRQRYWRSRPREGLDSAARLTAAISLNLGIMNLLPIPILDGGVILLLFIESLMQNDISLPIKERIYQAAFVFLVLFAVMVIYNDLVKTLPGLTRMP